MTFTALEYFNSELVTSCAELSEKVNALQRELESREDAYRKQSEQLALYKHRYELLQQQLFGKKSERRELSEDVRQTVLPGFDSEEHRPEVPLVTEHIDYTRRKPTSQGTRGDRSSRFPAWLRREVEVIAPEVTLCPCCHEEMERAEKPQITEKLCCNRDPFYVKEYHRHLYTCPSCKKAATKPPVFEVFERSLFDHTTVAFFLLNKFAFSLPLCRQAKMLHQLEIKVSDDSLIRICNEALSLLLPVYEAHCASTLASPVIVADDTRFQAATGKKKTKLPSYKRGCLWGIVGTENEVVYSFTPARTHEACCSSFDQFKGYLVVDGYDGFEKVALRDDVTIVHCNNHARRKFVEAEKSDKKRAHEALAFYQALYQIEEQCRDLSPPERQKYREKHAPSVLGTFRQWLDAVACSVIPKTPLAQAVSYVLTRWNSLTVYLKDGRLPFDTMQVERAFRVVAIGRKNFLHASSETGAQMAAVAFSLIETCNLQGIDPFIYLADVLQRVSSHPARLIQQLIPKNWKALFLDEATKKYLTNR